MIFFQLMSDLENGVKAWYSEVSVFDPASISPELPVVYL